jgi:hypothetical protein
MANPIEIAKAHPIAATVGVIIFGVVLMFMGGGSQATSVDGGADGELAGSIALQQMQAQLQARQYEVGAQKEVALNTTAAQLTAAQLAKEVAMFEGANARAIEEARLAAAERTTTLVSTLEAKNASDRLKAETDMFNATQATIRAQQQAALQLAEINSRPRGLLSFLFG